MSYSAYSIRLPQKQQGIVAIMLVSGMLVILGMIGLAIDFGHTYLNKTRLQNVSDALALSGAKVLNETGSTIQANAAMSSLFTTNLNAAANKELKDNISFNELSISYSNKLNPFIAGGQNPRYVRVSADSMVLQSWFVRALGVNELPVTAEAIAGPSSTISSYVCSPSAVMLCGDSSESPDSNNGTSFWGYVPGAIQKLKTSSKSKDQCIGPGNFQLISVGSNGASAIRDVLAGDYNGCADLSAGLVTKPGNTSGPTSQGINTRFGIYDGSMKKDEDIYPPDVITTETTTSIDLGDNACKGGSVLNLDFNYADYQRALNNQQYNNVPPEGAFNRRILRVPIGDCGGSSKNNGKTTIPYLGLGCFFLLKSVGKNDSEMYGEFIEECLQDGAISASPSSIPGPYKIILHDNPMVLL